MASKVITRFAPSPTGYLHVGNVRTALVNYLYTKKYDGKFILRMDDTDLKRSKDEFKDAIIRDLSWLGLNWDDNFNQRARLEKYEQAKQHLIKSGRLYACYETPEELEVKRKLQLSRGMPPIYDRGGLNLSEDRRKAYEDAGRRPHYRFLVNDVDIVWNDLVKGEIRYRGSNLGDPVIVRADGTMTYMLCSTVDDIEYEISHVIRGEDHVSNTAIQIQMFEALGSNAPVFGHLSLVTAKDEKISKREGGYEISSLRDNHHFCAMAINSFFTNIGSSNQVVAYKTMEELLENFDITTFSKSPTTFMPEELDLINHKLVLKLDYDDVKEELAKHNLNHITEQFWLAVRPNLEKITDIQDWWKICHEPDLSEAKEDQEYLSIAAKHLPQEINDKTWSSWTKSISEETGRKGKKLFMPLRIALTGKSSGPELRALLPLLSRDEILKRLSDIN